MKILVAVLLIVVTFGVAYWYLKSKKTVPVSIGGYPSGQAPFNLLGSNVRRTLNASNPSLSSHPSLSAVAASPSPNPGVAASLIGAFASLFKGASLAPTNPAVPAVTPAVNLDPNAPINQGINLFDPQYQADALPSSGNPYLDNQPLPTDPGSIDSTSFETLPAPFDTSANDYLSNVPLDTGAIDFSTVPDMTGDSYDTSAITYE